MGRRFCRECIAQGVLVSDVKVPDIVIEQARETDAPAIALLLSQAGLPDSDLAPHLAHFLVAREEGGSVVGAIGAEVYSGDSLLRSLVVAPPWRGSGLGSELLRCLETKAEFWKVKRWWLLTTTAEKFFVSHGFEVCSREMAPPSIQRTGQFSGGCCRSAVCLTRERQRNEERPASARR